MALTRLMYVSSSRLDPAAVDSGIDSIVNDARRHNSEDQLTGALLFSGTHFVQILEGDAAAIDCLMQRLHADPRHEGIIIVEHGPVSERRFGNWAMAYSGPSQFVARRITHLLNKDNPSAQRRAARWLVDLMYEFTKH